MAAKNTGIPYEWGVQAIFQAILDQERAKTIDVQHNVKLVGGPERTHECGVAQARMREKAAEAGLAERQRKERASIHDELCRLFAETDVWRRGKRLEAVMNRWCAAAGILVRDAFTVRGRQGEGVVEQIDGVIALQNHLYLVEMKWHSEPLGVEHVGLHMSRVSSRGAAVRGIFISASGSRTRPSRSAAITLAESCSPSASWKSSSRSAIVTEFSRRSWIGRLKPRSWTAIPSFGSCSDRSSVGR